MIRDLYLLWLVQKLRRRGAEQYLRHSTMVVFCRHCGKVATLRCAACREVWYCSKEHQKIDWKKKHKTICNYVQQDPTSFWVTVAGGQERTGIGHPMDNYFRLNKDDGLELVSHCLHGNPSPPLRSEFAQLLGWDIEIYCNLSCNRFLSENIYTIIGNGEVDLNPMGIYLGCRIESGLSAFLNLEGPIVVTGRRVKDGKPLVSDALWGIYNFIFDAMKWYGREDHPLPRLRQWAEQFRQETWQPRDGSGIAQIYTVDPYQCRIKRYLPRLGWNSGAYL